MLFPEEHTISQGKPRLTLNKIKSYVSLVFKTEAQEEVRKIEKDKYHIMSHMWNLKYVTDELIYKTETDSQTEKKINGYQREEGVGWEIN